MKALTDSLPDTQKDFFLWPNLVPKNHWQNIAEIGSFEDDFWRLRFLWANLDMNVIF